MLCTAAREWLGDPTPEILAAVEEKRRFVSDLAHWPQTPEAWEAVRSEIATALDTFADVERALGIAGIPDRPGYLGIDERTLRATFLFSNRLRARYTTVDFLEGQDALGRTIDVTLA
jgi:hypothetical protein